MRFEEIDEALRRQPAWEPPRGFAHRVAGMAQASMADPPPRLLDVLTLVPAAVRDMAFDSAARLGGLRWTLRQYWLIFAP